MPNQKFHFFHLSSKSYCQFPTFFFEGLDSGERNTLGHPGYKLATRWNPKGKIPTNFPPQAEPEAIGKDFPGVVTCEPCLVINIYQSHFVSNKTHTTTKKHRYQVLL